MTIESGGERTPDTRNRLLRSEANLAKRVRELRLAKGWSQERVAGFMTDRGHPLHQTSVAKIERVGEGHRPVSVDEALALADVFGVNFEDLLVSPDVHANTALRSAYEALDRSLAAAVEMDRVVRHDITVVLNLVGRDPEGLRTLAKFLAERGRLSRMVINMARLTTAEVTELQEMVGDLQGKIL